MVVALVVAAYANSLEGVFLFDDIYRIVENPAIRSLWPIAPLWNNDRPLVEFSLAINHAIGELDPRGYHLFNIAVHALAALTLAGVVGRSIRSMHRESAMSLTLEPLSHCKGEGRVKVLQTEAMNHWLAWSVAAIWAVHPLQTQSVTYIIQRGESMMGLFYLLTLYCAIRRREAKHPRVWFIAAMVACILGMASKAVMVTAPVVVLLHDFVFWKEGSRGRKAALFAGLSGTWIVLVLTGLAAAVLDPSKPNTGVGMSVSNVTPLSYLLTQAEVIVHYVRLTFLPVGLCLDYEWPFVHQAGDVLPQLGIIVLSMMVALGGLLRRKWWGFAAGFFFLVLAPTSSFMPIKDAIFEHRMYLPLAGVIVLAIGGSAWLVSKVPLPWHWRIVPLEPGMPLSIAARSIRVLLFLGVVASLTAATHQRNKTYATELTMWSDVAAKRPSNARARVAIGNALLSIGRLEDALASFREAIRIRPDDADAHAALGMGLARAGDLLAAVAAYESAIRIEPRHAKAHFNLANAFQRQSRFEDAVAAYRRAVESNSKFADAYCNLGNALGRFGRDAEAELAYRETLRVDPDHTRANNNLGDLFLRQSRPGDAVPFLQRAIAADPKYANAHANLAAAFWETNQTDLAEHHARVALELVPDHPTASQLLRDLASRRSAP